MTKFSISKLQQMGGNRWRKHDMDRIYLNVDLLGTIIHDATGHILNKTETRLLTEAKFYYDVADGKFHWCVNRDSQYYSDTIIRYLRERCVVDEPTEQPREREHREQLQIWDDETGRVITNPWEV